MPTQLDVAAELEFSVASRRRARRGEPDAAPGRTPRAPGQRPRRLRGAGGSGAVRGFAAALADAVWRHVVSGGNVLLTLGRDPHVLAPAPGDRAHATSASAERRGALAGARGRVRPGGEPLLPDRALAPPTTLLPLAPTFMRRRSQAGHHHPRPPRRRRTAAGPGPAGRPVAGGPPAGLPAER